jgi:hypothetical protein
LKYFPASVRVLLPVDPADPHDLRLWIDETIRAKPGRFAGLPGAIVRRLRWTALDIARKARRRLPRSRRDDRILLLPDSEPLDHVAATPPAEEQWASAIENLASDASAAAASLVDAAMAKCKQRKTCAVLACLARSIAAVRLDQGPEVAAAYLKHLACDPVFRQIPIAPGRRRRFITAMAAMNAAPASLNCSASKQRANVRRDLKAAGQPGAQNKVWKEFREAFNRHRAARLASAGQTAA